MLVLFIITLLFLLLRLGVAVYNFIDKPYLVKRPEGSADYISILIPVRNEEKVILDLLNSIKNQSYQQYEVLILDDHSSDNTAILVKDFCNKDERFRLLKGKPLPQGWLGKNWACHQLAQHAQYGTLVFTDADVVIEEGFLPSASYHIKSSRLNLLSVFNDQRIMTWGEWLLVPNMHFILLSLLPLRLTKTSPNPAFSAASGQCMVFDSLNYKQNEWHEKVKSKVAEDIEIMKAMKTGGHKTEAVLAGGLIKCRMYTGFNDALIGFSKNMVAGFGNVFGLIMYIFITILIWFPLVFFLPWQLITPLFAGVILLKILVAKMSNQNILKNVALIPFQAMAVTYLAYVSIYRKFKKNNTWKGRAVDIKAY